MTRLALVGQHLICCAVDAGATIPKQKLAYETKVSVRNNENLFVNWLDGGPIPGGCGINGGGGIKGGGGSPDGGIGGGGKPDVGGAIPDDGGGGGIPICCTGKQKNFIVKTLQAKRTFQSMHNATIQLILELNKEKLDNIKM